MGKAAIQETAVGPLSTRDSAMMGSSSGFGVVSRTADMIRLAQTIAQTEPSISVTDVAPDGFHAIIGPTSTTKSRELMFINDSPLSVGSSNRQVTSGIDAALFMGQLQDKGVIITTEPHNGSTSYEFVQSDGRAEHAGSNGIAFDKKMHTEAVARQQKKEKNLRRQANANRVIDGTRWKRLTPKRSGGVYKSKK